MLVVGEAAEQHADDLLELIREHAAYEQATAGITREELLRLLTERHVPVCLFVAQGDRLQGYAALTFDHSLWRARRFAHLDCLFVRASDRGKGTGARLFAHVVDEARASGADRLEWQTPDWNRDAIRFYERQGGVWQSKARFSLTFS